MTTADTQAVILAGGLGTRLRPQTLKIPKPLMEVNGKPFLEHQINMLKEEGFNQILILSGYLGHMIEDYFGDGKKCGIHIEHSIEPEPLGTAGALKLAAPKLKDVFFLLNGDSYLPISYKSFLNAFLQPPTSNLQLPALAMLGVYDNRKENTGVPGNVELDAGGRITGYRKPKDGPGTFFVDAGVSLWKREVVDLIPAGRSVSLEEEIYPVLIKEGRLQSRPVEARFYDIGTPQRLQIFEDYLKVKN